MKKVLIASGSTEFPEAAFDFVRHLYRRTSFQLTGLFLPEYDFAHLWLITDPGILGN